MSHLTIERVRRGAAKAAYRTGWSAIARKAGAPTIRTLYSEDFEGPGGEPALVRSIAGPVYIEPVTGYAITEAGQILEESVQPNRIGLRPFDTIVPSPAKFFRDIRRADNVMTVPVAVSLRHLWEWNYYHFFIDVLGKLETLKQARVDPGLPLVLGGNTPLLPFIQEALQYGCLANRSWVIPDRCYVRAEQAIFCRARSPLRSQVEYLLSEMSVPDAWHREERRVFLNRSGTRRLSNLVELRPVLEKHSFEVVDAAGMALEEQIRLFAGTRHLVAIHGAGTTNIIFRGGHPLGVLELHHENFMNYCHRDICHSMGHVWDELVGVMEAGHQMHANFTVSAEQLDERITELLAAPSAEVL